MIRRIGQSCPIGRPSPMSTIPGIDVPYLDRRAVASLTPSILVGA